MNLRSAIRNTAFALCMIALCVVQLFGGQRSYICVCSGKAVPVQTSHCHGPHGPDCVEQDLHSDATHQEGGAGERKDHQLIGQEFQIRPAEAAPLVFAPAVFEAVLPSVAWLVEVRDIDLTLHTEVDLGDSPPVGIMVARTVILLI